jgi:hypothetical protein
MFLQNNEMPGAVLEVMNRPHSRLKLTVSTDVPNLFGTVLKAFTLDLNNGLYRRNIISPLCSE